MADYHGEAPKPPLPPVGPFSPPRESRKSDSQQSETGADLQHRLIELEKRLQQEKEKVLLANLRSQEEAAYAAKAETAIKDVQEKLRRDRRESDLEEGRLKLEAKIRELETRLVQERETWVSTLQEQVKSREGQDKEVETHFIGRMEEMERRWLDEKAHWQKLLMAKDEELRNLRNQIERFKPLEIDLQKALQEKKYLEDKALQLAPLQARLQTLEEKERELFQVKAEFMIAKEQTQNLRSSTREREERLLTENERLHQEVQSIAQRMRIESENEIKQFKNELSMAGASILKLRAVAGALERQRMALKTRLDELTKVAQLQEQERSSAKAELIQIQTRWEENELRIRQEAETAIRARFKGEVRQDLEGEWRQREAKIRKEMEEGNASLSQRLDERIQNLHNQVESLEAKLSAKNDELLALQEKLTQAEAQSSHRELEKLQIQEQRESELEALSEEQKVSMIKEKQTALEELQTVLKEKKKAQEELEEAQKSQVELEAAQKVLEQTQKALEEAKSDSNTLKTEIAALEKKLSEERNKRKSDLTEQEAKLKSAISEEDRKQLDQLREAERTWLQQKAELEKKAAQLKEQLENFSDVARQNTLAACREMEGRIRILEEEIDEYRKPKASFFDKLLGQNKPKPPEPPKPPTPPDIFP